MNQIPGLPWGDISTGALLAVAVVLLLTGRLIPRTTHDREIADKDAQITYLQAALDVNREKSSELLRQNGLLLDAARSGTLAAAALQQALHLQEEET
ncbi:hypothetical protein [Gordonia sp. NB41Y]|uniref:hypothetical protein n=1 Tax=Gordonia sp. NB41Y TaxID=875808 RepID=UPI0006B208E6|nr:hypothetical protein [Gordonia sp. NB41Y]EMP10046.2 hypothetical protein ISGA_384 [Gordonia sp. NB41Y]WLP90266.1 hypothetical protein Q9K23_22575 [Gordonia sp. NB41Y]